MAYSAIMEAAQYLTFTLDREVYAVEITRVREVIEFSSVTKVPRTPDFMRGVINLRGNVVPVVDLKLKFGMGVTEQTVDTCSVIIEVKVDDTYVVLGALADSVQEVIDLEPDQIEPPPRIGTRLDTAFIRGMGTRNGEFVIILDIDQIFAADEITDVMTTDPDSDSAPADQEVPVVDESETEQRV